jgi:hypothetical protein
MKPMHVSTIIKKFRKPLIDMNEIYISMSTLTTSSKCFHVSKFVFGWMQEKGNPHHLESGYFDSNDIYVEK